VSSRSCLPRLNDRLTLALELGAKVETVGATSERLSPSVARPLSPHEADQLGTIALGLPESWVVQILPPFGQLGISPAGERLVRHRCHTAWASRRVITRENGCRPAL
jgi:hypothetical protein